MSSASLVHHHQASSPEGAKSPGLLMFRPISLSSAASGVLDDAAALATDAAAAHNAEPLQVPTTPSTTSPRSDNPDGRVQPGTTAAAAHLGTITTSINTTATMSTTQRTSRNTSSSEETPIGSVISPIASAHVGGTPPTPGGVGASAAAFVHATDVQTRLDEFFGFCEPLMQKYIFANRGGAFAVSPAAGVSPQSAGNLGGGGARAFSNASLRTGQQQNLFSASTSLGRSSSAATGYGGAIGGFAPVFSMDAMSALGSESESPSLQAVFMGGAGGGGGAGSQPQLTWSGLKIASSHDTQQQTLHSGSIATATGDAAMRQALLESMSIPMLTSATPRGSVAAPTGGGAGGDSAGRRGQHRESEATSLGRASFASVEATPEGNEENSIPPPSGGGAGAPRAASLGAPPLHGIGAFYASQPNINTNTNYNMLWKDMLALTERIELLRVSLTEHFPKALFASRRRESVSSTTSSHYQDLLQLIATSQSGSVAIGDSMASSRLLGTGGGGGAAGANIPSPASMGSLPTQQQTSTTRTPGTMTTQSKFSPSSRGGAQLQLAASSPHGDINSSMNLLWQHRLSNTAPPMNPIHLPAMMGLVEQQQQLRSVSHAGGGGGGGGVAATTPGREVRIPSDNQLQRLHAMSSESQPFSPTESMILQQQQQHQLLALTSPNEFGVVDLSRRGTDNSSASGKKKSSSSSGGVDSQYAIALLDDPSGVVASSSVQQAVQQFPSSGILTTPPQQFPSRPPLPPQRVVGSISGGGVQQQQQQHPKSPLRPHPPPPSAAPLLTSATLASVQPPLGAIGFQFQPAFRSFSDTEQNNASGGPTMLISVNHPERAASSLLVSFAFESTRSEDFEGASEIPAQQISETMTTANPMITAQQRTRSPLPSASSGGGGGLGSPRRVFASTTAQGTAGIAVAEDTQNSAVVDPTATTNTSEGTPSQATTQHPHPPRDLPQPNEQQPHHRHHSSDHTLAIASSSDSVFHLTPMINNDYVLLGGLGSFSWEMEGASPLTLSPPATSKPSPKQEVTDLVTSSHPSASPVGLHTIQEEVLLAYSLKLQRPVVVKMITPAFGISRASSGAPIVMQRFREARRATTLENLMRLTELRHPHLVSLFDVFDEPTTDRLYLVQEYCDGGTVASLIKHSQKTRETMSKLPLLLHMIVSVTSALEYLHRSGVAHRNVCAQNILLTSSGNVLLGGSGLPPECSRHAAQHFEVTHPIEDPAMDFHDVTHYIAADIAALGATIRLLQLGAGVETTQPLQVATQPPSPAPPPVTAQASNPSPRHVIPTVTVTESSPSLLPIAEGEGEAVIPAMTAAGGNIDGEVPSPPPQSVESQLKALVQRMTAADERQRPNASSCLDLLRVFLETVAAPA